MSFKHGDLLIIASHGTFEVTCCLFSSIYTHTDISSNNTDAYLSWCWRWQPAQSGKVNSSEGGHVSPARGAGGASRKVPGSAGGRASGWRGGVAMRLAGEASCLRSRAEHLDEAWAWAKTKIGCATSPAEARSSYGRRWWHRGCISAGLRGRGEAGGGGRRDGRGPSARRRGAGAGRRTRSVALGGGGLAWSRRGWERGPAAGRR